MHVSDTLQEHEPAVSYFDELIEKTMRGQAKMQQLQIKLQVEWVGE